MDKSEMFREVFEDETGKSVDSHQWEYIEWLEERLLEERCDRK
jgi:hypothetical protein